MWQRRLKTNSDNGVDVVKSTRREVEVNKMVERNNQLNTATKHKATGCSDKGNATGSNDKTRGNDEMQRQDSTTRFDRET